MREEALQLGPDRSIVGILTPGVSVEERGVSRTAVIILNAGLIHHVGPHRLHVILARQLAAMGVSALRVDFSGFGDSSVRPDNLPITDIVIQEPREIIDELVRRGYQNFVLFGICSGANFGLYATVNDPRINGLVLVNRETGSTDAEQNHQASAQYYWQRSLRNVQAWRNLFSGQVNYKKLFRTIANSVRRLGSGTARRKLSMADIVRDERKLFESRGTRFLIVFSDRQAGLVSLLGDGASDALQESGFRIELFPEADHLFTSLRAQRALIDRVCDWVGTFVQAQSEKNAEVPAAGPERDQEASPWKT